MASRPNGCNSDPEHCLLAMVDVQDSDGRELGRYNRAAFLVNRSAGVCVVPCEAPGCQAVAYGSPTRQDPSVNTAVIK